MTTKYLDENGLLYFWQKIKNYVAGTTPAASSTTPLMDGTGTAGSSTAYAREDHVHPSDTSRVPTTRMVNNHALSSDVTISASDIPCTHSGQTVEEDIENLYDITENTFIIEIGVTTFVAVEAARNAGKRLVGFLLGTTGSISGDWEDYSVFYDASASTYEFLRWEHNSTALYDTVYFYTLTSTGWSTRGNVANYRADTKNTAGSTDSSSKLFLVGATSQAANPQTYSQDTAYVGTDGHLYSNSKKVVNLSDSQALTNKTYNGYTLGAACAKGIVTAISNDSADLPTVTAIKNYIATVAPKNIWFANCITAESTTAKVATTTSGDFSLVAGNMVRVRMKEAYGDTAHTTLTVDNCEAKSIAAAYTDTYVAKAKLWGAGDVVDFVYDGSKFLFSYGVFATLNNYGMTVLSDSVSSISTGAAATSNAVKKAYDLAAAALPASSAGAAAAKGVVTSISADSTDLPTVTAVKNYIATVVSGATTFQGTAPTSFAPTNYKAGYYWVIGTAGTYAGQVCEAGDMIFAIADGTTYSAADFDVVQTNLDITSITNAGIDTIVAS